ncbi:MAG: DeoR family transcriptional regulator [Balneola sp.]|jgi:plasmid maintenance system antidote protein VapI|nr:DeoR family transcriptional regulator [Balneola sp.]MBE78109.1 DeoR family transcriptional regulator [Balneola sp.]HBX65151.1 DeoR family transcriptional regulator [Balneolaceae bacterium]
MNAKDLECFFETRPAINKSAFCKEVGISRQYLNMILNGERPLTDETIYKMTEILKKYGY